MRASNVHDSVRLLLFRQIKKVTDIASVNFSADDLELVAICGSLDARFLEFIKLV